MRRREFIAALGGAAAWPLAAWAQQRKVSTIGVLVVGGSSGSDQFWRLFRTVMREQGYVEGTNIRYEFRSDEGQVSRLPELAADLVRLNVDLIVTWFTPAAQAAKRGRTKFRSSWLSREIRSKPDLSIASTGRAATLPAWPA